MFHAMRRIIRDNVPLVLVLLGSAYLGGTIPTAAQAPTPAVATLTGTANRLVDQTIVGSLVIDETKERISDGRIAIPELGIDMPLAADGTFALSDLPVSADRDNPTEVTVVFTAPGLGSLTYLHLRIGPGQGPILTPLLTDTPQVTDVAHSHTHDDSMRGIPTSPNLAQAPIDQPPHDTDSVAPLTAQCTPSGNPHPFPRPFAYGRTGQARTKWSTPSTSSST